MSNEDFGKAQNIDIRNSRVTLGVMLGAIVSVVIFSIGGYSAYRDMASRVDKVDTKLEFISNSIITKDQQLLWMMKLQKMNPDLKIPIPMWPGAAEGLLVSTNGIVAIPTMFNYE